MLVPLHGSSKNKGLTKSLIRDSQRIIGPNKNGIIGIILAISGISALVFFLLIASGEERDFKSIGIFVASILVFGGSAYGLAKRKPLKKNDSST